MRPKVIASLMILVTLATAMAPFRAARADLFGGDVVVLGQILVQAIDEVAKLQSLIGKAGQTVSLLEEMNRGVKEVLKLAETAHVPLPPGVYEQAKSIDRAAWEARSIYGDVSNQAPSHTRTNRQSAVEALYMSQDAFDYSTFLDQQGERVKSAAILASPNAAARLTAETLGVLIHSNSHSNRIQAKELELSSSARLEENAKENARFETYMESHQRLEDDLRQSSFSGLNGIGW